VSQGEKVELVAARRTADRLLTFLAPSCERIEIAGSIRRGVPLVGDIEIVAMPRVTTEPAGDLWGEATTSVDHLATALGLLDAGGLVRLRSVVSHHADGTESIGVRNGDSYKALEFEGFPVDLFIVRDPDQWGVIFTIRTGPADWSHRLVTDCQKYLRRVEGGYLWRSGARFPCPEERDFFGGIGQPWVEPSERSAARVEIRS